MRRLRRTVLATLDHVEPWAAWGLLAGAVVVFAGVLIDVIETGNAKWATLLIAADLIVSGYGEVQDSADDEGSSMDEQQKSAITYIEVKLGDEGDAYYTAMYDNHEKGPRSEGYRGRTPAEALSNAREAAERDFPELADKPGGIVIEP